MKRLTYQQAGVDYNQIDPLKRLAQTAAGETGLVAGSRGESAQVLDMGGFYLAFVLEGLGTKALVADEMERLTGKTYYQAIAQDTLAMAINDIITIGARPILIQAYWAIGSEDWLKPYRMKALVSGWKQVCLKYNLIWGGGETPLLKDVVVAGAVDLAAGCIGVIKPKKRLVLGNRLRAGDLIVAFSSSGIHSNGLSLARKIAQKLPQGYLTKMASGLSFGAGLLKPTVIYSDLIQALIKAKVEFKYVVNITGHGWRKLMRPRKSFTYRITQLPPVPEVLKFLVAKANLSQEEAYQTFNMGAGLAIMIRTDQAAKVLATAKKEKIRATVVGQVEAGPKQVILEPIKVVYPAASLKLRD